MFSEPDPFTVAPGFESTAKVRKGIGGCLGGMFAIGCFGSFLLTVGIFGFVGYVVWNEVSPHVDELKQAVIDCPQALELLGEPVELGITNLRNMNINGDPSGGTMMLKMTVGGAKESGKLHVQLEGRNDRWLPKRFDLDVAATTIDLIACSNLEQHTATTTWSKDIETLGPELEAACRDERNGQACVTLGGFFQHMKQWERARQTYQTACNYGFTPACTLSDSIGLNQP